MFVCYWITSEMSSSSSSSESSEDEQDQLKKGTKTGSRKGTIASKPNNKKKKKTKNRSMCPRRDNDGVHGNLELLGGYMKVGFMGVSVPESTVRLLGKNISKLVTTSQSSGGTGVAGKPSAGGGYSVLLMGVLPNFLWLFLVFAYGVVNLMDATDPTIIDARNRNKWTYTITQAIAFFVLASLWFLTDRKYSMHGYSIMFMLFGAFICEVTNASKNDISGTTYFNYNSLAHNVNSMAAGIAVSAIFESMSRKWMFAFDKIDTTDSEQP